QDAALRRVARPRAGPHVPHHVGLLPRQRADTHGDRTQHDDEPEHEHQRDAAPLPQRTHCTPPSGSVRRSGGPPPGPESVQKVNSTPGGTSDGNTHRFVHSRSRDIASTRTSSPVTPGRRSTTGTGAATPSGTASSSRPRGDGHREPRDPAPPPPPHGPHRVITNRLSVMRPPPSGSVTTTVTSRTLSSPPAPPQARVSTLRSNPPRNSTRAGARSSRGSSFT